MNLSRPSADLSTIVGVAMIFGVVCFSAIVVVLHNPTVATLSAVVTAGGAMIAWLEKSAKPNPEPVPVASADTPVAVTVEQVKP